MLFLLLLLLPLFFSLSLFLVSSVPSRVHNRSRSKRNKQKEFLFTSAVKILLSLSLFLSLFAFEGYRLPGGFLRFLRTSECILQEHLARTGDSPVQGPHYICVYRRDTHTRAHGIHGAHVMLQRREGAEWPGRRAHTPFSILDSTLSGALRQCASDTLCNAF